MWRCVHQLANQKHSLILISNINAIHCPWIFSAYPEFSYFKHKILSYQIGILKPEPAIYRYAIDHFKLDPKSTLYIDDMPQNIASGREAGFQCWQYDLNNHQAFENWLAQALTSQ
ncbi:MAG: HAD-IA family hydrolase [Nitrosomonas sp.]|nr:HAD-IA family hydrolase [Nitrosomonas sp.]